MRVGRKLFFSYDPMVMHQRNPKSMPQVQMSAGNLLSAMVFEAFPRPPHSLSPSCAGLGYGPKGTPMSDGGKGNHIDEDGNDSLPEQDQESQLFSPSTSSSPAM